MDMNLPSIPLIVLDTETTGFVPRVHRIIEFASVLVRGGKVADTYEHLFFADEIPPHVEVLTRIRTADVLTAPKIEDRLEEILSHLPPDALLIGQNLSFDLSMLKGAGIDLTDRPWIDTSMLASIVFPELESYSLGYLSAVLQLNHEPQHRALGDVHATLELLEKCWERLSSLTPAMHKEALAIMGKSSPGYRQLFGGLPAGKAKKKPSWLQFVKKPPEDEGSAMATLRTPAKETVLLQEEDLDPHRLASFTRAAAQDASATHWLAVKNIDAFVRRTPHILSTDTIRVIYPPSHLLDPAAAARLMEKPELTADEATVALKLAWYEPRTRNDFPLHGGEDAVWYGKLSCTETSEPYLAQLQKLPHAVLIDHRQLLRFLASPEQPAEAVLGKKAHVIVDDASMLEDTATKAYGWLCAVDDLRAASQGHPLLTRFTDLLQLWIEKVRQSQDIRYLSPSDLAASDAKGLREQLETVKREDLPPQTQRQLEHLGSILSPENLQGRFAWIEKRQNGSQTVQSVPERIAQLLQDTLYHHFATTLLIPPGSADTLTEIAPPSGKVTVEPLDASSPTVPISFPVACSADEILRVPPAGKTIVLLGSRGSIETLYVKHMERLETQGVTLICQGLNGGQGRMQAEFLAAPAPTLWLITPWTFEGIDLPPGSVDHLIIGSLPFDYYSHPVLSRRAAHYRDSFIDYFFPRLLHRLFRLLRTFCHFKTAAADVRVLDDRIRTKEYGKKVVTYLLRFTGEKAAEKTPPLAAKKVKKTAKEGQLPLF